MSDPVGPAWWEINQERAERVPLRRAAPSRARIGETFVTREEIEENLVPLTVQGAWDELEAYPSRALVDHNNLSWVSREPTDAGDEPGVSEKWVNTPLGTKAYVDSVASDLSADIDSATHRITRWAESEAEADALGGAVLLLEPLPLFFHDFEDQTLDEVPSGWTLRWVTTDVTWLVKDKHSRRVLNNEGGGRQSITLDAADGAQDVEVLTRVRIPNSAGNAIQVQARTSGGAGNESGYAAVLHDGSGLRIDRWVDGTLTTNLESAGAAFSWSANTWYWVRFRAEGTELKAKAWADGTTEPSSWMVEVTDATHTEGRAGAGGFSSPPGGRDFDIVSIALDGYEAADAA